MSGAVETELRKLEKIVPGVEQAEEQMEMVSREIHIKTTTFQQQYVLFV